MTFKLTDDVIERAARAIEATMFAPHELPLPPELHAKYLATTRAAAAVIVPAVVERCAEEARLTGRCPKVVYDAIRALAGEAETT